MENFRLYPTSGKLYFEILIFPTTEGLRSHANWKIRRHRYDYTRGKFHAITFTGRYSHEGRLKPMLGEIMFARPWLQNGIIAHEINHAALYWARRRRIDPMDDSVENGINGQSQEEIFARVVQSMVDQFHEKCSGELMDTAGE